MFSLPSLFVPTAMPPSPPHPLWRFPVKCNLHVTMERQWGCPPPLTAPRGSWEGKATQRSAHVPEGHSDSSILCPAPVMLPAQKGTLYETWQDLSTGQEELALWLFFYSWGGWQKRRGTSVLLTPPIHPPSHKCCRCTSMAADKAPHFVRTAYTARDHTSVCSRN